MSKTRFTPWIVLACIGTLAGCTSGEGGTAGNTELNVVVPNGDEGTADELDIQVVEYTIACDDGIDSGPFLDNGATLDDDVTISGVLEVLDTPSAGVTIQDFGPDLTDVYVWQGFMDLPPTAGCTVQLRARDGDGEVICTATETFDIVADSTTKVNVLMYCGLSFQAPVGMLDLDGDFSFNVANFCPDIFVLNCIDSELDVQTTAAGDLLITACQVRFRDGDSSCGGTGIAPGDPDGASSCDPQVCVTDAQGLSCAPNPAFVDPVVTTVVVCSSTLGACAISCDGFGTPAASCTFTGDTLGVIGAPAPGFGAPGPGGFYVLCATFDHDGDPLTPEIPLTPGDAITCTATTTDGDTDCNKTKVADLTIAGLSACDQYVAGGGSCDDLDDCTDDVCNDLTCDPLTGAGCCSNPPSPAGTVCVAPGGGLCDGAGTCVAQGCLNDNPDCNIDGDPCTVGAPNTCVAGSCTLPEVPGNDGGACDPGAGGSGIGICAGGSCLDQDACKVGGDCVDGDDCTDDVCSGAPLACSNPFSASGTSCNAGLGVCDGAGNCNQPFILNDNVDQTTNWRALPKLCTEGIFDPTANTYECCQGAGNPAGCVGSGVTTTDVAGGGLASATSDPTSVVDGCAVPSSVLGGQLAVDVFLDLTTGSSGGILTTNYEIRAINAGLGIAAAIANLTDLTIDTEVTSGNPSNVFNLLNSTLRNTPLASYIAGLPATLTLSPCVLNNPDDETAGCSSGEINPNAEAVVPTTAPTMAVNFSGNFLLELFLTTAMAPLPVDGASCVFDIPGPDVTMSTTDPNP